MTITKRNDSFTELNEVANLSNDNLNSISRKSFRRAASLSSSLTISSDHDLTQKQIRHQTLASNRNSESRPLPLPQRQNRRASLPARISNLNPESISRTLPLSTLFEAEKEDSFTKKSSTADHNAQPQAVNSEIVQPRPLFSILRRPSAKENSIPDTEQGTSHKEQFSRGMDRSLQDKNLIELTLKVKELELENLNHKAKWEKSQQEVQQLTEKTRGLELELQILRCEVERFRVKEQVYVDKIRKISSEKDELKKMMNSEGKDVKLEPRSLSVGVKDETDDEKKENQEKKNYTGNDWGEVHLKKQNCTEDEQDENSDVSSIQPPNGPFRGVRRLAKMGQKLLEEHKSNQQIRRKEAASARSHQIKLIQENDNCMEGDLEEEEDHSKNQNHNEYGQDENADASPNQLPNTPLKGVRRLLMGQTLLKQLKTNSQIPQEIVLNVQHPQTEPQHEKDDNIEDHLEQDHIKDHSCSKNDQEKNESSPNQLPNGPSRDASVIGRNRQENPQHENDKNIVCESEDRLKNQSYSKNDHEKNADASSNQLFDVPFRRLGASEQGCQNEPQHKKDNDIELEMEEGGRLKNQIRSKNDQGKNADVSPDQPPNAPFRRLSTSEGSRRKEPPRMNDVNIGCEFGEDHLKDQSCNGDNHGKTVGASPIRLRNGPFRRLSLKERNRRKESWRKNDNDIGCKFGEDHSKNQSFSENDQEKNTDALSNQLPNGPFSGLRRMRQELLEQHKCNQQIRREIAANRRYRKETMRRQREARRRKNRPNVSENQNEKE